MFLSALSVQENVNAMLLGSRSQEFGEPLGACASQDGGHVGEFSTQLLHV